MIVWSEVSLDELGQLERGRSRHRPRNDPRLYGGSTPFFQTGDVKSALLHLSEGSQFYSEFGVSQSRVWQPGVTCITIAANIAETAILGVAGCFPDSVIGFTPRQQSDDAYFVKYLLDVERERLSASARGTTQENLSLEKLVGHRFRVPDPTGRTIIVRVLRAFDDLIENNRRRITLLEQIEQAIYQEWFVRFRYPGHLVTPLDAGGLPDGWTDSTLGDQLDVLESGTRPRGGVDPAEHGVPSVGAENVIGLGRYRFEAEKFVSESFFNLMRRGQVRDGDVLLYKDGAHIGRHSMFRDGFPHRSCAINEHVFRLRARSPLTQNYLYFWIDHPETVKEIVGLNSNAAQPGISQAKLVTLPICVPSATVISEWEEAVEPMLALLFNLANRNRVLHKMRDALLPKLVTGAIDVSKLDLGALLTEPAA